MSFVFVYLDDILVASSSEGEHLTHLRDLFTRLNQHGLILNPAKCLFGLPSIHFLGHLINKDGAAPLPVPAALSMPLSPDLVVGAAAPATPPSSAPVLRTRWGRVIVPPRHRGFDYG
ncbi:hypothetical protein SKAU_G00380110 [Synaphobranchus kaupii]|uniref:ribonuclease H n=1 Tax=Synaphobranchus kaupii TaxID=118154 RepID=A0A9Q1EDJ2_SYNKA|nr:hypothetical protein SKAU_G00380110 [Synaphobranchus kaupii]